MLVSREIAKELASYSEGETFEGFTVVKNEMCGQRRWVTEYLLVVSKDEKFYQIFYDRGSTESVDERPFEYATDQIEFIEVVAVEKTVIDYVVKI